MTYRVLVTMLALAMLLGGCGNTDQEAETYATANRDANGDNADDGEQSTVTRFINAIDLDDLGGSAEAAADVFLDVALGAENGVIFYADDVLAHPDEAISISAKVQSNRMLPVKNAEVSFYLDDELLGAAKTSGSGVATIDIDGMEEAGDYLIEARITEVAGDTPEEYLDVSDAPLLVCVRDPEAKFVIVDLDHTVVDTGFGTVLFGMAEPMKGSQDTLEWLIDDMGYELVYLTHRPEHMTVTSKEWLDEHDFPQGPLLTSGAMQVVSDDYKPGRIREILDAFPNTDLGIGDKLSDAQAYLDAGLTAFLIPHVDKEKPQDLREMAREIDQLTNTGRLQVVDGWGQIRRSVDRGATYPRETYVRDLRDLARRLGRDD
jgi:hypothetical protein